MLKEEVIRLLREDAAFREEVRRQILSDELVALPAKVERLRAEMHEEFERVWKAIGSLTARVDALAEAQQRTEARLEALTARVDALAEAQRRTEAGLAALTERVEVLTTRVDGLTQTIGRIEERWGLAHEQIAQDLVPDILQRKGWKVLKATPMVFDGEMDLVVAVEADGRLFTLATEVKGRVWSRTPMDQVVAKARQPAFVAAVRREGFPEPIVPVVFGIVIYSGAEDAARQAGVGLISPHGELVAPFPQR